MKTKLTLMMGLLTILMLGNVLACSCIFLETTQDKYNNAQLVFQGKAIEVEKQSSLNPEAIQKATFQVSKQWKGDFYENLVIYANEDSGANCGYNFEEGKEYLIYAYTDQETGQITTNSCMGNSDINQEEIRELDSINPSSVQNDNEVNKPSTKENIFAKFFNWIKNIFG